ncbi:hypothetical protein KOI35_01370 [Actinoplanes bogorensis]|uniref:Glycosyltransferase n=1 Tax=Paractinoplanes bogorensis TaxID=1610840 RepID=A0ABS5YFM5_9ACTN|nr:hypothetical protein [Actinoplanes bogorensis]MBU2662147.1 hypothetical protein [Actinoplanes bogorensis]
MYDVAILSDLRYPGSHSASIAAEVRAQAAAGLTTVLIHRPAPGLRHTRPFASRIVACLRDGLADLAHDGDVVEAKVLLIRRFGDPAALPAVSAAHTIVVVDEPLDHYPAGAVLAPVDGRARAAMPPGAPLTATDWHDIIDGAADPGSDDDVFIKSDEDDGDLRPVLEAMAAGVPVILGPRFRSVFAEAAAYAHPGGREELAERLRQDRPAYEAQAARAESFVTEHYGSASHIARLASLGVLTRGIVPSPREQIQPSARPARRVLFVGDDIARFRAIARRLPADLEPVVVAGSAGLSDAHAAGLLTEYLPSAEDLGADDGRWAGFVRDRLRHLIDLYGPKAVLVGGVPHDGIAAAVEQPGPRWLWLRPAMWRRGTGGQWAARGALFAGILEPGEFAAGGDEGWTTTARAGVSTVDPITELPRKLRRRTGEMSLVCRGVEAVLPGFTRVEARPEELGGVAVAVSRADYTNFHELLGAGVPTVFVPDPEASDDELARARFAAAAGVALCATDDDSAASALERLADPAVREALGRRCAELSFGNGAADAAEWLAGHCRRRSEVEAQGVR